MKWQDNFIAISNFENVLERSLLSKGYDYIENVFELKVTSNDEYDQWQATDNFSGPF